MKNTLKAILLLLATASLALAQTPLPFGPSNVTPTPSPSGNLESGAQSLVETHHYVVNLAAIQSISGTSGTIPLFTFPVTRYAGVQPLNSGGPAAIWMIDSIVIRASTPISGGGITDVTAQIKTGNNYGSATHVFTGASNTPSPSYVTSTTGFTEAGNTTVNLALVSAGGNLSAATAGRLDILITWRVL